MYLFFFLPGIGLIRLYLSPVIPTMLISGPLLALLFLRISLPYPLTLVWTFRIVYSLTMYLARIIVTRHARPAR